CLIPRDQDAITMPGAGTASTAPRARLFESPRRGGPGHKRLLAKIFRGISDRQRSSCPADKRPGQGDAPTESDADIAHSGRSKLKHRGPDQNVATSLGVGPPFGAPRAPELLLSPAGR